ncbi:hypothetical protein BS78_10G104500 [Paspalum vaginatum]|nr:hypothetical protein BS78_10G104500 [Paspalum vaginatum]
MIFAFGDLRAFLPCPGGRGPVVRDRSTAPAPPSFRVRRHPRLPPTSGRPRPPPLRPVDDARNPGASPSSCVWPPTPAACPPAMVGGSAFAPPRIPPPAVRKLGHILDRLAADERLQRCADTYAEARGERERRPPHAGAGLPGRGVG